MPSIELVRQCVEIRVLGQRVMEGRVEHGDLRNAGAEHGAGGLDAAEIVRVVERGQVGERLEAVAHLVGNEHRRGEMFAAVNDAVAHGVDVGDPREGCLVPGSIRGEPRDDVRDRGGVIANGRGGGGLLAAAASHGEDGLTADALDLAAGEADVTRAGDGCVVGIDELELERRRSDVEDENPHGFLG
jgi:hypothetical protein